MSLFSIFLNFYSFMLNTYSHFNLVILANNPSGILVNKLLLKFLYKNNIVLIILFCHSKLRNNMDVFNKEYPRSLVTWGIRNFRYLLLMTWIIWLSNLLNTQYERTWWRLFPKHVACTKLDIYVLHWNTSYVLS